MSSGPRGRVVSGRTGYPAEMLDRDLDLEGDLSIDSITRTEILAEPAETLGTHEERARDSRADPG